MIHWFFTISRLCLAPICFYLIYSNQIILAEMFMIYAIFSDYADGYFARKLNQVTIYGALADATADKIFIYCCSAGYQLKLQDPYFAIVLGIWITRDLALNLLHVKKVKRFKSLFSGKCFTALQFVILFLILLFQHFDWNLDFLLKFSMPIFVLLGIYSLIQYRASYRC